MVEASEVNNSLRLERLERIYEENPGTRLFLALAEEYFRDGQLEKAVEVCRGGLETFPGYTSARVTLARSLIDLGQDAEAEVELGAVLGNSPDNLLASRLYAALLIRQGRLDEAMPVVDRLLELSPDDEEGLRFRGQLEQPAEPDPGPGSTGEQIKTSTLARLYEEQGLREKALGVYDTLLSMNPDNQEIAARAAALRSRLAEEEDDSAAGDAVVTDSARRRIENLGRLLDAARALSPNRSESG
jgi:tetratricopeptide (TPR) repeat protein